MISEDSDTVLLNDPSQPDPSNATNDQETPFRPPPLSRASTTGIKKCWICICDATEDDPNDPPVWRNPCSCSLTAHEACLLDWVADLENPKNRKRQTPPAKIECPQCKNEIKVTRPRSYVVEGVRAVDRAIEKLVLPGLGFSFLGTVWAGAWVHGFYSVLLVCGRDHAQEIFTRAATKRWMLQGYALVPFNLIFARTRYADYVLPTGTMFLGMTQLENGFAIDWTIWPPLPSTVFACLPVAGSAYNWVYEKAFGEMNRRWIAEVQPRQNERVEGQDANAADQANIFEQERIVLELEVNIGAGDAGPEPEQAANVEAADDGPANAEADGNQLLGPRGDEIIESSSSIFRDVVGALAFPAVAAGMGELLSFALPAAWMSSANFYRGRPGLLRHKWGRTFVGGCVAIVLKDAFVLYCRWKMAQSHRQRSIMNFDKKTKKYVSGCP